MSKTLKKKKHWSSKVQECAVSWGNAGELSAVLEIRGGAEHGEFPHLGQVLPDALVCHVGRLPAPGDVLLEVNGTPVSGLTNRDTLAVIRHFREPLRLKTVKPGNVLNTDLRHYLSLQFQKGSLDHKLQQVIRDNLYLRTIPCTTRQPREGEVPGVDYNFISAGEFRVLEESGLLLESGTYDGNYYGTPKPPAEPSPVQPDLVDQVLFDEEFDAEVQRKRTTSVSKMDRKDSAAPEEEEEDERPPMVNGLTEHKEGPEWRKAVPSYTQSSSSMDFCNWNTQPRDESQEPLPKNWEMAYTETGMVYFIDHNTKTTTWLDPRLAKKAKPPEKCDDGELPYGWEKIEDPQYGTYYVDHINQKTQFENPVQEAKKKLSQDASPTNQPIAAAAGAVPTPLSDVIVDINGTCVLGKTHADVVQMFQSIPVNQYVDMVLCRGYPLPEDTNSSEEGTGDITALPGMDGQPIHLDGTPSMQDLHYMTTDGRHPAAAMPNGRYPEAGETTLLQPELVSVPLVKGPSGFGFAIADCPLGQKVKMILDAQWCRGLLKGDVIKEINRQNVQTLTHAQVVDILKDLPMGSEVNVLVLRGGQTSPVKSLKPITPAIPSAQKQDIATSSVSTETPSPAEPGPQTLPFPPHAIRSNSPKLDPSELYLKSKAMLDSKPANTKELDVFIRRNQETGFGFRVLGGEGPDQPVYIGAIVPLGAAEKDGRLRAGDELICIDGVPVKGKSHKQVLELMTNAARNGQVMLTVRRKQTYPEREEDDGQPQAPHVPVLVNGSPKPHHIEVSGHSHPQPYDVTLQRKDNEGFGFVILTSKNKPPPGVIPHKIGRIIDGSPTDRCGRLKVGDRISAVNGQSIIELSHNDIVQLIKEAGNAVTLTVVPEEEHSGPPSGTSSAKQSPATQHRAVGQQPASRDDRNGVETDERKDTMARAEYKSQPQGEMATVITSGPKQGCYPVELERGQRGFGFSLRGGKEYNMGLFILRLAEDGPALKDGRIHVGDQIVEINGEPTQGITHTRAIELIQAGGNKVLLLLRHGLGQVPDHNVKDTMTGPSANSPRYSASNEPSTPASPSFISHSPELKPSPPEELFFDPVAASHGQLHQHYRDAKQQIRKSDPSMPRDNNDNFTLPRRQDRKERSRSPKKTLNMDNRNDPSEREPRSTSPRKTKKENSGIRQEMPQKATDGLKPNSGRRYKDEDTMHKQDRETGETRPEVSRGGSDRYQSDKTAEPQRSESGTLNRKDHRGRDRPEDIESVPQETPHNGNPTTKRGPITPGPWKVPSSTRVQPPVHGV
ncbi:membrane-associated guanylate kinase, WW and PDZ domain-containing protein 3a isoform X2 [Carassius carassius]|uniref:membrane-associated guanylate kinase, WW and PDZ domain-containing protein 3a isoform X2 n=1 Tax=Carassius carassius TaxID=217509 RepID=UPI00286976CE|nr:membrane-associated guanylate kinase, WW and PDZ domain-containing protein 3a isoform X2 [Carassius carassius]